MKEELAQQDPAGAEFQDRRPPVWMRDAALPVGRGRRRPAGARATLDALPRALVWLAEVRTVFAARPEDLTAHLKAAEWFLDNYTQLQRSVRQVREDMPRPFLRALPVLEEGPFAGLPRARALAAGLVHETELVPDAVTLRELVQSFQESVPLTMAELWALPAFLRLCVLEELASAVGNMLPEHPPPLPAPVKPAAPYLDEDERAARCIRTLRALDMLDWKAFFVDSSLCERILEGDPARAYARADFETRDRCRKRVEAIARRTRGDELEVARAAIELARARAALGAAEAHVGQYLLGAGRGELEARFAYRPAPAERLQRLATARPTLTLIGSIAAATGLALCVPAAYLARVDAGPIAWVSALALALVPASTLGVGVVHWFLTNLLPPRVLPKLDFEAGIDPGLRTLVVVPCLLGSAREVQDLVRQLELHHLRNPDPTLAFALLSDWLDAPQRQMPDDAELLVRASTAVRLLNQKYGEDGRSPFHLLHRAREWNGSEGCWMGRERKRGKLEELNELLLGGHSRFEHVIGAPPALEGIRYVITLDAGTVLPPGAAARLVGTLAHPLNRAEFDQGSGRPVRGYTVVQPRVEIAPTATAQSRFTRIFSGDAAIDIYSRAVSDVYQDLCGEGIYVGKGIYDVPAFARSLEGRVPENRLVSHDHFEGLHGRAALASDVVLYEDYPPQYLAFARRMHRWIRGDWQLLPWLFPRVPHAGPGLVPTRLSVLGRWILFDNLRRSLLAPTLVLLLAASWLFLPGRPGLWTALAILAPAGHVFTGLVSGLARGPRRTRVRPWLAGITQTVRQNLGRWILFIVFLAHEAAVIVDAIVRTLYRLLVSRRRFLQWRTAEHTAQLLARRHPHLLVWTEMAASPLLALALLVPIAAFRSETLPWSAPMLGLWIVAPEIARRISRQSEHRPEGLSAADRAFLRGIGRRTWYFFETFAGPSDQWLPPDNHQEEPRGETAHRTSPTNVGMYLVSAVAAWDLGWQGTTELLFRLQRAFDALGRMETFRGHTYNWYDTRTLEPLLPRYVSTVDSGNLAAALLIAQQACAEAAAGPLLAPARWDGLLDTLDLLAEGIRRLRLQADETEILLERCRGIRALARDAQGEPVRWASTLDELCARLAPELDRAVVDVLRGHGTEGGDWHLREVRIWLERTHNHLRCMHQDLKRLAPWTEVLAEAPRDLESTELLRELRRLLAPSMRSSDVSSACRRARELIARLRAQEGGGPERPAWCDRIEDSLDRGTNAARALLGELLAFGVLAEERVRAMDFRLVYDAESRLLHIGYDVTSGRIDANRYDLLASEARIASFLAIAKGDVPVEHWFFLGRPATRIHGDAALLSWGGTMFEYLMPQLFMQSGERTFLAQSCRVAVRAQLEYGSKRGVPWGISESGFYEFDQHKNYQYRAFGVPNLGLKRGLTEDLVVAPYASVIALELLPREVISNLERFLDLGGMGTYGCYEALDFTAGRAPSDGQPGVVRSYMAHHQGMILAAIDNALQGRPLVRRFHSTSLAQTAELLLHENVPVGVSPQTYLEEVLDPPVAPTPRWEPVSWGPPAGGSVPETHVLSNGRLTTGLTDSGGGWLEWHGLALTRWRADSTRDDHGTWIYVRDERSGELCSIGVHPGDARPAEHHVIFHSHAAEIHRRGDGLLLHVELAVAPREDVEVRLVTVTNESGQERQLTVSACLVPVLAPAAEDARHPAFSRLFVESEHLPESGALLFQRRRRSPDERAVVLVHSLVAGEGVQAAGHETDRARFLGRGRGWDRPLALSPEGRLSGSTGAVLDPVSVLQARLELPPGASRRLAFLTTAGGAPPDALETARRLRSLEQLEWIFEDARTTAARELSSLRIPPRLLPAVQRLTSLMLHPRPEFRCDPAELEADRLGKPGLWGLGISGDVPLLLLELEDARSALLLSQLLLAHRWWRRCGLSFDLVLLSSRPSGYAGEDDERIGRLIAQSGGADWRNRRGGIFSLHADQMRPDELRSLRIAARVLLRTASGRLADQLAPRPPSLELPLRFLPAYAAAETAEPTPELGPTRELLLQNGWGGFSPSGREYVVHRGRRGPPPAPWCNVLCNADFGCLVSESGLGATWSRNATENRLTPWRNDPVSDEPSEVVYVRDEETGAIWTPTPLPIPEGSATRVRHGAGWSEYKRSCHGLDQELLLFVPREDPLKVVSLRLRNIWDRARRLTVTYYAELVLGALREESAPFTVTAYDPGTGVLFAHNAWNPEYGQRVAFLAADAIPHGFTADRFEFLGRRGSLARPAALRRWGLSGSVGTGADPCHALMMHVELEPGEERTLHFFLGDAADRAQAIELVRRFRSEQERRAAWMELETFWDGLLGTIEVRTPEPAMDLALNRWLLYQSVSSRLEGRIGPYQSSGAFGFRDQLQDVMALVHAAPERARAHVLEAAGRQFAAGDVLHWWHPPGARGVRTRCSDDLLWLPFVACHYARATGDLEIFSTEVPFLEGEPLADEELERYRDHVVSSEHASLLEHCRRALERGVTRGLHGLPLIGTCDWNDGMNRVGPRGLGESVWLAWFAIATLQAFAEILGKLGSPGEASEWSERARELAQATERSAWDGAWYLRAWYDDGTPLGSAGSQECSIDSIAQAWAAISGAGDPARSRLALDSVLEQLVSEEERLVRLLRPPFDQGPEDPGYIKAYPPGVRENGGQYTHGATWLGWAFASLGDGERAERMFRLLNPLERGRSTESVERYRVEPYVVAADVYAGAHAGRGGWTWYTGAAAWLWRLGVEGVLGLRREGGDLRIEPCIPPSWEGFEATVRTPSATCRILVENPGGAGSGVSRVLFDGQERPEARLALNELVGHHEVRLTLGDRPPEEARP